MRTFKLSFEDQGQKKKNGIVFQSVCKDNSKISLKAPENENLPEVVALLSIWFTKFKNKFYKKAGGYGSQTNQEGVSSNCYGSNSKNVDLPSKRCDKDQSTTHKDKSDKFDKSVRCHECEGYRHFQAECPTYLKKKKKILNITLSDEDTLSDSWCEDYGRSLIICEAEGSSKLSNNDELLLQAVIEPKLFEDLEREGVKKDQLPPPIPLTDFEELL